MNSARIAFLDYARGFCMLAVVVYHCLQAEVTGVWAKAIAFGGAGVHVFLFLSGFGLTLSSLRSGTTSFFKRRFVRILLPYYVFVTFVFLLNLSWTLYEGRGGSFYAYLGHIFLFKMFDESIIDSFGYHLWFLSTIIQFYLLFPLLFTLQKRIGADWLLGIAILVSVLSMIVFVATGVAGQRVYNSSCLAFMWEFVFGMWAAHRYVERGYELWELPGRRIGMITLACAVMLVLLTKIEGLPNGASDMVNNLAAFGAFGGVVVLSYRIGRAGWLPGWEAAMIAVSQFSYELYLTHHLLVSRLWPAIRPESPVLRAFGVAMTVVLCILTAVAYRRLLTLVFSRQRLA